MKIEIRDNIPDEIAIELVGIVIRQGRISEGKIECTTVGWPKYLIKMKNIPSMLGTIVRMIVLWYVRVKELTITILVKWHIEISW